MILALSYFVPEIQLVLYLDKFEFNMYCTEFGGAWNWYENRCYGLDFPKDEVLCTDTMGGIPKTTNPCKSQLEWNLWNIILPMGCHHVGYSSCEISDNISDFDYGQETHILPEPVWYDENRCSDFFDESICNQPTKDLTKIIGLCEAEKRGYAVHNPLIVFENETHYIDNLTCKWGIVMERSVYPGTGSFMKGVERQLCEAYGGESAGWDGCKNINDICNEIGGTLTSNENDTQTLCSLMDKVSTCTPERLSYGWKKHSDIICYNSERDLLS